MKKANRKKLFTIKKRIFEDQFREAEDADYAEALMLLGKAMDEIEEQFGDVDC